MDLLSDLLKSTIALIAAEYVVTVDAVQASWEPVGAPSENYTAFRRAANRHVREAQPELLCSEICYVAYQGTNRLALFPRGDYPSVTGPHTDMRNVFRDIIWVILGKGSETPGDKVQDLLTIICGLLRCLETAQLEGDYPHGVEECERAWEFVGAAQQPAAALQVLTECNMRTQNTRFVYYRTAMQQLCLHVQSTLGHDPTINQVRDAMLAFLRTNELYVVLGDAGSSITNDISRYQKLRAIIKNI